MVSQAVSEGTLSTAERTESSNILEIRPPWARIPVRASLFRLCFAIPAALIAVYATVLSDATNLWQTATLCWVLTALVIGLIGRIASIVERCEREASQEGTTAVLPVEQPRAALLRTADSAQERLVHLERVIVRQHRFVSDAAHELRTPLTAQCVVGESMLGKQTATNAQLRDAIVSMLEESKHMKRLIEALLDLTRASLTNAAEQGISRQPVALDVSLLAHDCVESLRVLAEEKQQSIEVSTTPGDILADADLTMVRQALLNVIHNAMEHCPAGTHIQVATERCPPNEALIRIQDNGPGIPLEEQHYVFERFYRGAGASRQRSLGLGLSIAKAVLCSQGGGIELRSAPGEGCCFVLKLPLAAQRCRGL